MHGQVVVTGIWVWEEAVSGESRKDVYERVRDYVEHSLRALLGSGKSILLVAHRSTLEAVVSVLNGEECSGDVYFELRHGELKRFSYTNGFGLSEDT